MKADTVSLPAVADTGLWEVRPTENSGSAFTVRVGNVGALSGGLRTRGLFQFDPAAQIPNGSTITSAKLTLTVSKTTDFLQPRVFELRRMLVLWAESEASWNVRLAPDVTWSAPGGADGQDFSTAVSAAATVVGLGNYSWGSTTGMVADVQRWLDDSAGNHGWMLRRDEETTTKTARLFNTGENGSGQPMLTVEFTPPFRISSVEIANNQVCLQFAAQAGQAYVVERRVLVDSGAWFVVTNLPPALADGPVTVCDPLATDNHFYRVGRQ